MLWPIQVVQLGAGGRLRAPANATKQVLLFEPRRAGPRDCEMRVCVCVCVSPVIHLFVLCAFFFYRTLVVYSCITILVYFRVLANIEPQGKGIHFGGNLPRCSGFPLFSVLLLVAVLCSSACSDDVLRSWVSKKKGGRALYLCRFISVACVTNVRVVVFSAAVSFARVICVCDGRFVTCEWSAACASGVLALSRVVSGCCVLCVLRVCFAVSVVCVLRLSIRSTSSHTVRVDDLIAFETNTVVVVWASFVILIRVFLCTLTVLLISLGLRLTGLQPSSCNRRCGLYTRVPSSCTNFTRCQISRRADSNAAVNPQNCTAPSTQRTLRLLIPQLKSICQRPEWRRLIVSRACRTNKTR